MKPPRLVKPSKIARQLHTPTPDQLRELGRMLVHHSFLDLVMSRTIKMLDELSEAEANALLANHKSGELRKRAEKAAQRVLGCESDALVRFSGLLKIAKKASETRNVYAHAHWKNRDGELSLLDQMHANAKPLPSASELAAKANLIYKAALDIDEARARPGGFLHDAVRAARAGPI
jgi:hypothetical protein